MQVRTRPIRDGLDAEGLMTKHAEPHLLLLQITKIVY